MQAGCDEPTVGGTCWGSVLYSAARNKVAFFLSFMGSEEAKEHGHQCPADSMGSQSASLLLALQIVPGFLCNCLFLALYDSVVLLKHVVLLLSRSKPACHERRRMLTSEGLRCVWNSFLLDAYKQVKLGEEAPNSSVVHVTGDQKSTNDGRKCGILDFASPERPLVVNFGSAS
ncbi:hypothetical protein NDU88_002199 [Pleurodeles waltl]|uniref:Iodothyronine deiodinase n=2 Tax=Pleurodeles waltl TaxID=8319 RepID=A0AAV7MM08_PLEWA|nr:hypothetical protein NDU88_002199 [Pleurodeles waltl]